MDHFRLLGLPRRLTIDAGHLRDAYFARVRESHPDRHGRDAEAQRTAGLRTSALNLAYRTLSDPIARARYWLELHAEPLRGADVSLPTSLADLHFAVHDHRRAEPQGTPPPPDLSREQTLLVATRASLDRELRHVFSLWDFGGVPSSEIAHTLRGLLLQFACVDRLLRDIDELIHGAASG